jgi:hypothetical protein
MDGSNSECAAYIVIDSTGLRGHKGLHTQFLWRFVESGYEIWFVLGWAIGRKWPERFVL